MKRFALRQVMVLLALAGAASFGHGQVINRCVTSSSILLTQEPCPGAYLPEGPYGHGSEVNANQGRAGVSVARRTKRSPADAEQARQEALVRIYNSPSATAQPDKRNQRPHLIASEQRECDRLNAYTRDYWSATSSRDVGLAVAAQGALAANRQSYRYMGC